MNPLVGVTALLFALMSRLNGGPPLWHRRLREVMARRLPCLAPHIARDKPEEGLDELREHLGTLLAEEQRRLVYDVAREAFGLAREWDRLASMWLGCGPLTEAQMAHVMADDELLWRVIALNAVLTAGHDPELAHRSRCAFSFLRIGEDPRRALAELLAPYDERAGWIRVDLGCPIELDARLVEIMRLDEEPSQDEPSQDDGGRSS